MRHVDERQKALRSVTFGRRLRRYMVGSKPSFSPLRKPLFIVTADCRRAEPAPCSPHRAEDTLLLSGSGQDRTGRGLNAATRATWPFVHAAAENRVRPPARKLFTAPAFEQCGPFLPVFTGSWTERVHVQSERAVTYFTLHVFNVNATT